MADATNIVDPYDSGWHNQNSMTRVGAKGLYRDVSTVCVRPTRGMIHARVVQAWESLMTPMNQKFVRFTPVGFEVGHAYSQAIEQILANEELSTYKYLLTLEEDNVPPPDGVMRIIERMEENPEFAAIGGLYWTKGPEGQPMIYGNPEEVPLSFRPQPPVATRPDGLIPCCGLGMGFTIFRMDLFKDERVPRPWFRTVQEYNQAEGGKAFTQDLWFFQECAKATGARFACDSQLLVGHFDAISGRMW